MTREIKAAGGRKWDYGKILCVIGIVIALIGGGCRAYFGSTQFFGLTTLFVRPLVGILSWTTFGLSGLTLGLGMFLRWPKRKLSFASVLIVVGLLIFTPSNAAYTINDLVTASEEGDMEAARKCLAAGVPINGRARWGWSGENEGETPLSAAASAGREEMARLLLDRGAAINFGGDSFSPLDNAVVRQFPQVVKLLLEKGADPNLPNGDGDPPLYFAAWTGNIETAQLLIRGGARIDIPCPVYISGHGFQKGTFAQAAEMQGHAKMATYLKSLEREPLVQPNQNP